MLKTILILCGEKPHQDPRTRWHAEFLKSNNYNIDIISYTPYSKKDESFPIAKIANIQNLETTQKKLILLYIKSHLLKDLKKVKLSIVLLFSLILPILIIYRPISIIKRKYIAKRNFLDYFYKCFFLLKQHIIISAKLDIYLKQHTPPHIIICQEPHTLSPAIARLKNKQTTIIYDAHEISYDEEIGQDKITKKLLKQYEESLLKHIHYFITVSDNIRQLYIKNNPHLKNISLTIPNINSKIHIHHNRHKLTPKNIKFLLSSSYFTNKGLEEFIAAWKELNPQNATLYLRIFNPDRYNKNFQRTLNFLKGGYKNIILLPHIPQNEVVSSYAHYDIGVIFYNPNLNLNYKYCCPNKFGEYIFAGLAILSTNSSYLTTKIKASNCGAIYDPNNNAQTKQTIINLISSPDKIELYKNNAYKFARKSFNYEQYGKKLLNFIQTLVK